MLLIFLILGLLSASVQCVIYGLSGPAVGLETVDPRTGFQRPLGFTLPSELEGQQLSSVDVKNQILYVIGYNATNQAVHLLGIDLQKRALVTNNPLPFQDNGFVGVGQSVNVNTNTGEVFVSGRDQSVGNQHHLILVNPQSGSYKSIATIGDIDVLGGASCYDAKYNVVWLQFGLTDTIDLFSINVSNGNITSIPDPLNMETMDFDPVSGLIYGVGLEVISPTNYHRVMLSLNSATNVITNIAPIPGYFIIYAAESALDPNLRKQYSLLQPLGNSNAPFQLVEYDLTNNTITNHPNVGGNSCATCPWSIHYST